VSFEEKPNTGTFVLCRMPTGPADAPSRTRVSWQLCWNFRRGCATQRCGRVEGLRKNRPRFGLRKRGWPFPQAWAGGFLQEWKKTLSQTIRFGKEKWRLNDQLFQMDGTWSIRTHTTRYDQRKQRTVSSASRLSWKYRRSTCGGEVGQQAHSFTLYRYRWDVTWLWAVAAHEFEAIGNRRPRQAHELRSWTSTGRRDSWSKPGVSSMPCTKKIKRKATRLGGHNLIWGARPVMETPRNTELGNTVWRSLARIQAGNRTSKPLNC